MSRESVIKLIEAAENDQSLNEQLCKAQGPEVVLTIASERGYEFNEAELLAVMQERQLSFANNELSDEQLEAVVGGKGNKDEKKSNEFTATKSSTVNFG